MSDWLGITGAIKFVNNGIDTDKSKIQLNDYMSEATKQFMKSIESTFEWELVDNTDCASYTMVINANIIDMTTDYSDLYNINEWLDKYLVSELMVKSPIDFLGIIVRGIVMVSGGFNDTAFIYSEDHIDNTSYWKVLNNEG